jgi:hypothetical protein
MVGTPGKPVTPSSTITLSTCAGYVNERSSTRRAAHAERHDHLVQAVVERERQHAETTSSSFISRYVEMLVPAVSMLRCVSITPLGSPVLPEV